jgi:hypothetical protein
MPRGGGDRLPHAGHVRLGIQPLEDRFQTQLGRCRNRRERAQILGDPTVGLEQVSTAAAVAQMREDLAGDGWVSVIQQGREVELELVLIHLGLLLPDGLQELL